jgi:hypothetical protein
VDYFLGCLIFALLKNTTMLKLLLPLLCVSWGGMVYGQSCVRNLDLNYTSNNLIAFFDAEVVSNCPVLSYYWDFGDNDQSTLSNPVHTFPAPGYYLVCLSITVFEDKENVIYSYCENIPIGVSTPCSVQAIPSLSSMGAHLFFESEISTGINTNIVSYEWDFNDGNYSSSPSGTHEYSTMGEYVVCLRVEGVNGDETCVASSCKHHLFDLPAPALNVNFSLEHLGDCEFKANSETTPDDELELESRTWILNGETFENEAHLFEHTSAEVGQELCLEERYSFHGTIVSETYCVTLSALCEWEATNIENLGFSNEKEVLVRNNGASNLSVFSEQALGEVKIFSLDGRLVYQDLVSTNLLDLSFLSTGTYLAFVGTGEGVLLLKGH